MHALEVVFSGGIAPPPPPVRTPAKSTPRKPARKRTRRKRKAGWGKLSKDVDQALNQVDEVFTLDDVMEVLGNGAKRHSVRGRLSRMATDPERKIQVLQKGEPPDTSAIYQKIDEADEADEAAEEQGDETPT
ncbi:MAG: hypothetical protein GY953_07935 [bacterium]|nr:hypothetical protein [bacterium]